MKRLIGNLDFTTDESLRLHYIGQHSINKNNEFFEDFFLPDNSLRRCENCMMEFKNCRLRKNYMFLPHYNQSGANLLRRGPITYS